MAKRVVALHNHTDQWISFSGTASGKTFRDFPPSSKGYGKGRHEVEFDIPDNSDSSRYWESNNMAVMVMNEYSNQLGYLSFWDDDYDDFKIKYYTEYGVPTPEKTKLMRGGDHGGNHARVVLHVHEHPPRSENYELTAVALTDAGERKHLASGLREFTKTVGMRPDVKHNPDALRRFMGHPEFNSLRESAAEGGFQSVALVSGGGGSLGAGVEVLRGILSDQAGRDYYEMRSTAITVGAEEGIAGFAGLYLSTEHASKVGGLEFFAELAGDLGEGIALRVFTTFWGGAGLLILLTTGEEIEVSVGLGETTTQRIA